MRTNSAPSRGKRSRRLPCLRSGLVLVGLCAGIGSYVAPDRSVSYAQPSTLPRERLDFNDSWRFQKGDPAAAADLLAWDKVRGHVNMTGSNLQNQGRVPPERASSGIEPGAGVSYAQPEFDDTGWRKLDLPHDWGIEGPFNQDYPGETGKLPWWGVGWYRKHFRIDARDKGRLLFLDIDGAMSYAMVWLNGKFIGGWPYGYSSFQLELTPHIRFGGENVLSIRLDNPPSSSRWYPGGGIYRNVWLVKTEPIHVAHWGTFVTTPEVSRDRAKIEVAVTLENQSDGVADVSLTTQVFVLSADRKRQGRAAAIAGKIPVTIKPGEKTAAAAILAVPNPRLWSIRHPDLYSAVTTVERGG